MDGWMDGFTQIKNLYNIYFSYENDFLLLSSHFLPVQVVSPTCLPCPIIVLDSSIFILRRRSHRFMGDWWIDYTL